MSYCKKCESNISKNHETIICNGFCEGVFHLKCIGVERHVKTFINSNKNILWTCDDCLVLKGNKVFLNMLKTLPSQIEMMLKNDFDEKIKSMEQIILKKGEQIEGMTRILNNFGERTPGNSTKRFRFDNVTAVSKPESDNNNETVTGTKDVEVKVKIVPHKFWFHLSPFDPKTTEVEITDFVTNFLEIEDTIDVRKLIPKTIDPSRMTFSSFRIGVNNEHKFRVMDRNNWPQGVKIRKFIEKSMIPVTLKPIKAFEFIAKPYVNTEYNKELLQTQIFDSPTGSSILSPML